MPKYCAPGKGDSVSCFTQSSLEKIANHWNQQNQDNLIYQTKKQCALIEVKSTAKGTQTFDLPQHLKRNTSATYGKGWQMWRDSLKKNLVSACHSSTAPRTRRRLGKITSRI